MIESKKERKKERKSSGRRDRKICLLRHSFAYCGALYCHRRRSAAIRALLYGPVISRVQNDVIIITKDVAVLKAFKDFLSCCIVRVDLECCWEHFLFFLLFHLSCWYPLFFDPPFGSYFDESKCLLLIWGACSRSHLNLMLQTVTGISYRLWE